MRLKRNRLSGKYGYLYGLILLSFISVICVAFGMSGNNDFDVARREVLLRQIGHEILLQSGDSTSRVLPVKKTADDEYKISFENQLTFQTDSLVNTTRRLLAKDPLAEDYVVNVLNSEKSDVAYGYAISENKKDDIIACTGRKQPQAAYLINIKFKPTRMHAVKKGVLLAGLPFLAFLGFIFLRSVKPRQSVPDDQPVGIISLGSISFNAKNRTLINNGKTIDLTGTETRLLLILASSPNQTIERSRLQKEIWEDEGVIVGRSLDMFISKLRKKLESDPNVNLVVIRSKGYKLEIGA